jgi:hypothetical protein
MAHVVRPRQAPPPPPPHVRSTTSTPPPLSLFRTLVTTVLQSDTWSTLSTFTLLFLSWAKTSWWWSSRRGRFQLVIITVILCSLYPYARYTKRQRRLLRRERQRQQETLNHLLTQQRLVQQQQSYSGTTGPYISRAPSSRLSSSTLSPFSILTTTTTTKTSATGKTEGSNHTTTTCLDRIPLTSLFGMTQSIGGGEGDDPTSCAYDFGDTLLQTMQAGNGMVALRDALDTALHRFQYTKKVKPLLATVKGKRVLDIGMGAGGPWYGAALLAGGVTYYVGTEPNSCPTRPTPTRNPHYPKRPTEWQCRKECNLTTTKRTTTSTSTSTTTSSLHSEEDEIDDNIAQYLEQCTGGSKMYRNFPLTGLQMMAAYPGYMALLPGTLETLSSSSSSYHLSSITFDYILLKTVTEHVDDLHRMIRTLWHLMEPCSSTAHIKMDHHNFYGYSGHHGFPGSVYQAEYSNKTRTEDNHTTTLMELGNFMELADWGHVWYPSNQQQHPQYPTTTLSNIASDPTLNRVRPGDLQALAQVYFDCTCQGIPVGHRELDRFFADSFTSSEDTDDVPRRRREQLEARGFSRQELLLNHILLDCRRKPIVYEQDVQWINDQLQLYRPPLDGSYIPQPLQCETIITSSSQ